MPRLDPKVRESLEILVIRYLKYFNGIVVSANQLLHILEIFCVKNPWCHTLNQISNVLIPSQKPQHAWNHCCRIDECYVRRRLEALAICQKRVWANDLVSFYAIDPHVSDEGLYRPGARRGRKCPLKFLPFR